MYVLRMSCQDRTTHGVEEEQSEETKGVVRSEGGKAEDSRNNILASVRLFVA